MVKKVQKLKQWGNFIVVCKWYDCIIKIVTHVHTFMAQVNDLFVFDAPYELHVLNFFCGQLWDLLASILIHNIDRTVGITMNTLFVDTDEELLHRSLSEQHERNVQPVIIYWNESFVTCKHFSKSDNELFKHGWSEQVLITESKWVTLSNIR